MFGREVWYAFETERGARVLCQALTSSGLPCGAHVGPTLVCPLCGTLAREPFVLSPVKPYALTEEKP